MKRRIFIFLPIMFAILAMISNCSNDNINVAKSDLVTPTQLQFNMLTKSPPKDIRITATSLTEVTVSPAEPIILPSKKATLDASLLQSCIRIMPGTSDQSSLEGSLVLYDRSRATYYVQNLSSGNTYDLPNALPYSIETSPDGKWIAYLQDTGPSQYRFRLIVLSADGVTKKIFEPTLIGSVTAISGWLGNDNIALEVYSPQSKPSIMVFDPFSRKQQKLMPIFPNIDDEGKWQWDSSGLTIYSPDLHYVVYPVHYGNVPPNYTVWNIKDNQKIAALLTGDLTVPPQWSKDSSSVAVTIDTAYPPFSASEFYRADTNGKVALISKLGTLFPNATTRVRSWSWSPDSRHIAFWLDFYKEKSIYEERLMMLDTQTGDIVDLCIHGDEIQITSNQIAYTPPPLWSYDGRSLLVENRYGNDQSRLIRIEPDNMVAYQVDQNVSPVGWLSNEK